MKSSFALALLLGAFCHSSTAVAQSRGTLTASGKMITPRMFHTATLLLDGRVLIAGGDSSFDETATEAGVELFDLLTGTFVRTGSMTTPRQGHTATLLPNGKVLIAGGNVRNSGGGYSLNSAELYDPDTGTFAATGNMTVERSHHTATLLNNGKVLIAGGYRLGMGFGADLSFLFAPAGFLSASAELYDPASGTFTATGDMNETFSDTATLLSNGKVLITRSIVFDPPDGSGVENFVRHAELYDPSTGTFAVTGDMVSFHNLPTATLLMNGKVLIAGGDIGDRDGPSVCAELYDPVTGTFAASGDLTTAREHAAATLLPDGAVLFAGGFSHVPVPGGGSDNLAGAEVYNPAAGTFRPAGAMLTGRDFPRATLLSNGKVLITGGSEYYSCCAGPNRDTYHGEVSIAELYAPAVLVPAPVLFSMSGDGKGQGAIWHAQTGQVASADSPATAGEALSMYTTSLASSGVVAPQVAIGGRLAEILYFGDAPGYPGYFQVNVRVPKGLSPGTAVPVHLTYIGRQSNEVTIAVQ